MGELDLGTSEDFQATLTWLGVKLDVDDEGEDDEDPTAFRVENIFFNKDEVSDMKLPPGKFRLYVLGHSGITSTVDFEVRLTYNGPLQAIEGQVSDECGCDAWEDA